MLKGNKYTYSLIKIIRKIQLTIIPYYLYISKFNVAKLLRLIGFNKNSPYEKLKQIKNKHIGQRCFIIATGPSLKIEDLEKLRNEITFGVNSICLAFEQTDWRPTYYGIQDEWVYSKLEKPIDKIKVEGRFLSNTMLRKVKINLTDKDYIFPMNMLNHHLKHKKYRTKFSENAFAVVYNGYSVTYSVLQLAVYMGFKEIYLLGADCNYLSDKKQHFKEYADVESDPTLGDMMISGFKEAKKYADRKNIKIYNATRGGKLEVFERVNLDTVISNYNTKSKRLLS